MFLVIFRKTVLLYLHLMLLFVYVYLKAPSPLVYLTYFTFCSNSITKAEILMHFVLFFKACCGMLVFSQIYVFLKENKKMCFAFFDSF